MIDLYSINRPRVEEFFKSAAHEQVSLFLINQNTQLNAIDGISMRDDTAMAHPLVALEYARWLDYEKYAAWALSKLPK